MTLKKNLFGERYEMDMSSPHEKFKQMILNEWLLLILPFIKCRV